MIRLIVEDYCQECPDFEPEAVKVTYYSGDELRAASTEVYCRHKNRCAAVAKYMKSQEKHAPL